jgi:RHS repeat-associated protein
MSRNVLCFIYLLLQLFVCLSLEASDPTNLQLLGSREGDPASIVEGVSTIYGDYSEFDIDAVVPGPDTLILSRFYSSNDTSDVANFGGWRFFPKCTLTVKQDSKRKSYSTSEGIFERTYVRIGTDEGSILTFIGWQNTTNLETTIYKVDAEGETYSMANSARGHPQASSNQKNNTLYYNGNGDFFELILSNHGKRVYIKQSSSNLYLLEKEFLPSGNKIFYEYDNKGRPISITMTNVTEEKVLSWIKMEHGKVCRAETSDKKVVEYHFEGNQQLLTKISSTRKPLVTYHYQDKVDHPLLIRKELPGGRVTEIEYVVDKSRKNRVHSITKAVSDSLRAKREFTYQTQRDGSGYTKVRGPSGEKTIHHYNEDLQLTSIEEYLNGVLYRTHRKIWGSKRDACNLIQSSIEDDSGNVHWAKTYSYDDQGNILKEKEYGNLTGALPSPLLVYRNGLVDESQEGHVKTYSYSQEEDVDVMSQTDMKGSGVRYYYKRGTNLILKKFIVQNGECKKRWFYEYNEDGALTQILVDDGNELGPEAIRYLDQRLITRITPKEKYPALGAPEIIEEKYFDTQEKQEILIKRIINRFDDVGNIIEQEIYDANGEHRYSLRKEYKNNLLVRETDPLGNTMHYAYDEIGNLIREDNCATGMSIQYDYNLENRLIHTRKSSGGCSFETSTAYNISGQIISETDQFGNRTHYLVDDLGRITAVIYPELAKENTGALTPIFSYEHDLFDHVTKITDPYGITTSIANTARGTPIHIEHPDGVHEFFKYDMEGSLHRHCSRDGTVRIFEYDYMGRNCHVEHYERCQNQSGEWLSSIYSEYDAFHLTSRKDEDGNETTYHYDGAGRLTSQKKKSQRVDFSYDPLGRLHSIKKWKTANTFTCEKKEYDLAGNVTAIIQEDETGKVLTKTGYSYDKAGRLIAIIGYPQNQRSILKRFEYDHFGRLSKEIDAFGFETQIHYEDGYINHLGQRAVKKIIIDPSGNSVEEIYDTEGNLVTVRKKDVFGAVLSSSQFSFDAFGNETSRNDSIGNTTYHLKKIFLPGRHLEEMHYATNDSEEKIIQFTYDRYGALKTRLEPGSSSPISYEYNDAGKLTRIDFPEEDSAYELKHDNRGNLIKVDIHSNLTLSYEFNSNNQLIEETIEDAFGSYSVACSYDGEGCINKVLLPDGSFIQYEYEGPFVKRASRISKENRELYHYKVFSRDLMGNILEEILPYHAGSRKYAFDKAARKTQITTDFLSDAVPSKGYDSVGNIKLRQILFDGEEYNISYEYDALNQLTSEKGENEHSYTYDAMGNRCSKDGSSYDVDNANQLIKADGAFFTFDPRGNLHSKSIEESPSEYHYNSLGQLTSMTLPDGTVITFTYDLSGKRLSKKITKGKVSEVFRYFYLKNRELGCLDSNGNIIELRIPSNPNRPERETFVAFELQNEIYVPIYDLQGNVSCLVDPERRNIQESYQYSAFGEEEILNHRGRVIQQSKVGNLWRYRGNRIDEETGLVYIGHRYYDPAIGRWISPDPLGDIDGPNLYLYCRNNPLTYVDYFGLASEKNNSPVDESYFYGEYEPHCFCERHRDCKRGGDIANDPALRGSFSIGSVIDLSLEIFSHPRVQGSMQAFAGLAEASAGGLVTLGSGGLAAPIGWAVLTHGLDQFTTGMNTAITGNYRATLTEQLLQTTGMPSEWASFTNDVLTIGGTMGGSAVIRGTSQTNKTIYSSLPPQKHISKAIYEKNAKHIFRNAPGHLADTPFNRKLLIQTARNSKNYLGIDQFGNIWHAKLQSDGSQIWTISRNGLIRNGGVNKQPIIFSLKNGLSKENL